MQVTTHAPERTAKATAAGTCGELAQGVLPDGRPFHVTCPIDRVATAHVRTEPSARTHVTGLARGMWKTERALLRASELLELPAVRIDVRHESQLERAKGLASSSADIVACVRALACAHGETLSPEEIATLAAGVEPTDGVMYDGVVAVDQHSGQLVRRWSWWPSFSIAMFRPGATRETGLRGGAPLHRHAAEYADLLAQLDAAAELRDGAAFAAQATRSAQLNEQAAPNPLAQWLAPRLRTVGAAGLCVGHSGTVCGLLFHGVEADERATAALRGLIERLPSDVRGSLVHTPPAPGA